jgi:hypothetical protein
MKRNALAALLLLLLGAALAEWLSTRDAHAQAFPPASSGGTSYTHPSAISLSNGIESLDGGTFTGKVKVGPSGFTPHSSATFGLAIEAQNDAAAQLLLQGRGGAGFPGVYFASTSGSAYAGTFTYSDTITGCWSMTRSGGYGASLVFCPWLGSGPTMSAITGAPTSAGYGLQIQSYNGSALETAFETTYGYPVIPKQNAGAPAAGDCDAASELGRVVYDSTNFREYRCFGTAGWKYSQML